MLRTPLSMLLLVFVAVTSWTCGIDGDLGSDENPVYVRASDFEQGCQTGAECVAVAEQACLKCGSGCMKNTALHTDALSDFEAAKEAVECETQSLAGCNNNCGPTTPLCLEGQCTVWQSDTSRLPRSCTSDDECMALADFELDRCWPESCPFIAVNKAQWQIAAGIDCAEQQQPASPSYPCDAPTVPRCDQGTCVLAE